MKGDEPQKDESIDGVVKIDVAVRVDEAAIQMESGCKTGIFTINSLSSPRLQLDGVVV